MKIRAILEGPPHFTDEKLPGLSGDSKEFGNTIATSSLHRDYKRIGEIESLSVDMIVYLSSDRLACIIIEAPEAKESRNKIITRIAFKHDNSIKFPAD